MTKKKISLVQVNFQQGPRELNAFSLPYTVGLLWCYLASQPNWLSHHELDQLVWRRDPIDQTAENLSRSDIVLFSTYVWNRNYNYKLAKKIKERNPKVTTIFGGPELPHRDEKIFEKLHFIDYVVKQEGELVIYNLLENLDNARDIAGLVINSKRQAIDTGDARRIEDLDQIPSPYLMGFFDRLISDNPDVTWNATLETNRGCPYQCTFCDWGSLTYSKIKKFNLDRVLAEIEWMGKYSGHITVADANFGMFIKRDGIIADKIIEVLNKYKKIKGLNASWAKNQKSDVIKIIKKLTQNDFSNGLTVSVQSMDNQVLDTIKRTNLNQHRLSEIFKICEDNKIPVYTEMILGLPGETLESWKSGVYQIFEHGNHHGIDFLQAQILVNAEMAYSQQKFYQMETVQVYDYMSGTDQLGDCPESVDIVISTRSLPHTDMLEAQVWSSFIMALHINSLTSWIARFLVKYKNINYKDFYDNLYTFMLEDEWVFGSLSDIKSYYSKWAQNGYFDHPPIGVRPVTGVNIGHRFLLDIHLHNKIDHILYLTKKFITHQYDLEKPLLDELLRFQKDSILTYDYLGSLPRSSEYDFDFFHYITQGSDLDRKSKVHFEMNDIDHEISHQNFLEHLWYSRKRFYSKLKINQKKLS